MAASKLGSLSGTALVLAGASVALWTVTHPWGTFAGAEVGQSGGWLVSHTFHFLAGMFGSLGLLGLLDRATKAGALERSGFVIAFVATVMFAGTGIFTAFVWPTIASAAPALTAIDGPFFSPPHPIIPITSLSFSLGYILLSFGLSRAQVVPSWVAYATLVGGVLLAMPPAPISPMPWAGFPLGGVLFGLSLAMIGTSMRRGGMETAIAA